MFDPGRILDLILDEVKRCEWSCVVRRQGAVLQYWTAEFFGV